VLLAAGASTRFGTNKLLHALPDGTPIAVAAATSLRAALDRVIAVVRPGVPELERALGNTGIEVSVCAKSISGMGHSLAHAVAATPDASGWIVALADMPFASADTIRRIAAALREGAELAAPSYRGVRGHPVGFGARYRDDLEALTGDAGARAILKRDHQLLHVVDVDDPGVLRDIDTPDDLNAQ